MWKNPFPSVDTAVDFMLITDFRSSLWKKPLFHGQCPQVFNTGNSLPRIPAALLFHKSTSIIVMTIL